MSGEQTVRPIKNGLYSEQTTVHPGCRSRVTYAEQIIETDITDGSRPLLIVADDAGVCVSAIDATHAALQVTCRHLQQTLLQFPSTCGQNMATQRFPLISQELQCFTDFNNFRTWSRNLTQVKQFLLLVNFLPRWVLQRGQANQKHPLFFCLFFLKGGRHRGAKQTELSFWVKMISGWFWHLKGQVQS